jgi:ATP-dependent DNA helicase RecQ
MPHASPPQLSSNIEADLHQKLHEVFGFAEFRPLQEDAIRATLEGRDVLVVMPTGAGKSLCFQLPAAISDGVTLVVSPLVALMRDQVEGLKNRTAFRQIGVASLNGLQSPDEQRYILEELQNGGIKLLYVAPERFRSAAFLETLSSTRIARFVVDEAHCISEWGHDFRPDYLAMRDVVEQIGRPPLLAVTATATLRVQDSIVNNLGMREPLKLVGGFNRPNLHYSAHRCKNETERQEKLSRALPKLVQMGGSGLIYVATRKQCDEVAQLCNRVIMQHGKRAASYHAGMDGNLRNQVQSAWLNNEISVIVATNAFGMGIDKPDVRFVVHYVYPESLESYYQEAGRAGRDGRRSRCVVLYHFADRRTREWFIENDALSADDVKQAHSEINRVLANDQIARIPRGWWNLALQWNEVKSRLALAELERASLVRRLGENGDETVLKIEKEFPHAALQKITRDLERQREERLRRLDEMVGYCKTTGCRRRATLSYFGDFERPVQNGFCCDNCERERAADSGQAAEPTQNSTFKTQNSRDRAPMPLRVEQNDIHSLLQAMDALHPKVGKARLNKLMRGSTAKDVQRFRDENCPLFGVLKGASEAQVNDFLEKLIQLGILHQADEDDYFIVTVTRSGRETWQTRCELDVQVPGAALHRDDITCDDEGELFENLRAWRRREASTQNLPPYCILSDRALLQIARMKPQNEAALRLIAGVGDTKIEKYGDAVLAIVRGKI